jgi:NhaA family Na+:H+ antiporter
VSKGAQTRAGNGILSDFQQFFATQSASGIILLGCTIVALLWSNSPWAHSYFELWHSQFTVGNSQFGLTMDLHHWINDGLMVLFFFVVGLEIKRELLVGELSQLKQAALPIFGALGGMLAPALIYLAFNIKSGAPHGWGVPVATDIAFALAILTLLGPRVPSGLKVFLVALAIVDDLGAVLVIALFYTQQINLPALAVAGLGLLLAVLLNWRGIVRPGPYAVLGVVVWIAVLLSGVHATVAGVLLALCIPARSRIDVQAFYDRCRAMLASLDQTIGNGKSASPLTGMRLSGEQQDLVGEVERASQQVQPPLDRLEHSLHPWIAYFVMPLFALSNAGVTLPQDGLAALVEPVSLGIMLGLVLGKQVGVALFVWLSVRFKLAVLPEGVDWRHIYGAAWVCGIGFTMSLFIASLAFRESPKLLDSAKLGVLIASTLAGVVGYLLLRRATRQQTGATA